MAQTPPPPPSEPAPAGGTPTTAGSNKKTYSTLAYILGWITGIIFLFVGKDDPDVKWNAANSVVVFGGLSVINIVLSLIPGVRLITPLVGLIGLVYWIIFLVKNLQGQGEKQPAPLISGFINQYVDQLANAVK
ncbi:MAG TPA: hypothetical protein VJR46_05290 [Candidatus Dormibacteraeota bacterium]|nr:hypothetical protein [Candidatus Dormibacteraeota bacterium]